MELLLNEEQKALQMSVRDFCKKEIIPNIDKWNEAGEVPWDLYKKIGQLGYFGGLFPEEYGGSNMGCLNQAIIIEELTAAWTDASGPYNQLSMSVPMGLYLYGTEEQKMRYIPGMLAGEFTGCFGLTEPGVGSDAAHLQTRAVRDGDHYVINGTKMWITYGTVAKFGIIFAKTDPKAGYNGITAFLVPFDTPGLSKRKIKCQIGTKCVPTSELVFEDVRVPVDAVLGKEGDGFKCAMGELQFGRITVASRCVGVARAALETAIRYANERQAFNQPIGKFQMIQRLIADAATEIEAARYLVYKAAYLADKGERFNLEGSQAKLYAAEVCKRAAQACVEVHGAYGVAEEYKAMYYEQFANMMRTGEGPSNIQRVLIAEHFLGYKDANRHPRKVSAK